MKKLIIKLLIAGNIMLGLGACSSHQNPLEQDTHDSGLFLNAASHYAEIKMQLHLNSTGYPRCLEQKLDSKTCNAFYGLMLNFAKDKPLFKTLTLKDLTNDKMWQKVQDDYWLIQDVADPD